MQRFAFFEIYFDIIHTVHGGPIHALTKRSKDTLRKDAARKGRLALQARSNLDRVRSASLRVQARNSSWVKRPCAEAACINGTNATAPPPKSVNLTHTLARAEARAVAAEAAALAASRALDPEGGVRDCARMGACRNQCNDLSRLVTTSSVARGGESV